MSNVILDYDQVKSSGIKILYKFKPFDDENHYASLLKNEIYFSASEQLNDPFDSKILTRFDLCTQEEKEEICKRHIENFDPINQLHIAQFKKGMVRLNGNPELFNEHYSRIQNKDIGIFSLTEKLENFLLWSYYADRHRGICIEYDAILLNNYLNSCHESEGLNFLFCHVDYRKELPLIHPIKHDFEERTRLGFLTKSCDWKHEEEWRILSIGAKIREHKIPQGSIKKIYFGVWCDEKKIEECKKVALDSNPEIKFFRAKKKKDEFGLDFLPI